MGIGNDLVGHLIDLKRSGRLRRASSVVEIGAQQLSAGFLAESESFVELFKIFDRPLWLPPKPPEAVSMAHGKLIHQAPDAPPARPFWLALGMEYAAIDVDGSPDAIPLDLNFDDVPPEARGRFDLVTNFGTTEHVCNQLNAFRVIHDLTRLDGLMMHNLPVQGFMAHGIVNYNPKFFLRLAESNGYEVVYFDLARARAPYPVQDHIAVAIRYVGGHAEALSDMLLDDVSVRVTLRKVLDQEFVPPLDVPGGATTNDPTLRQRYWTVFRPEAMQALSQAQFDRGNAAHSAGDYIAARIAWEPLAIHGHAAAQAMLGMVHLLGQGAAADPEEALKWLMRAAEQGVVEARMLLSRLLIEGTAVPRDAARGLWWLRQAAQSGHALAQNNLGMALATGKHVAPNLVEAADWFRRAAEAGLPDAQLNLAALHLGEDAAVHDPAAARHWLDRLQGNPAAAGMAAQIALLLQKVDGGFPAINHRARTAG